MRLIFENLYEHPLKNLENLQLQCANRFQEKLLIEHSPAKIGIQSLAFLE